MRKVMAGFVAIAALAYAGTAWAQAVNKTCPVKGSKVKAGITTFYEGKVIGFC